MSRSHQAKTLAANRQPVVELEAPQTRSAPLSNPDAAAIELPGESLARPNMQSAQSPASRDTLHQANPWPFYLDDVPSTAAAHGMQPSRVTSDTNIHPANPWPYHGIETDSADKLNTLGHGRSLSNSIGMATSYREADENWLGRFAPNLHNGKYAVDGVTSENGYDLAPDGEHEQHSSTSVMLDFQRTNIQMTTSMGWLRQANTNADGGSSLDDIAMPLYAAQISGNVHRTSTPGKMNNTAQDTQSAPNVNEDSVVGPEMPSKFTDTAMLEPRREHILPANLLSDSRIPNRANANETLHSQQTWHSSNGAYSQQPPRYSADESSASIFENGPIDDCSQGQNSYSRNTGTTQPFVTMPESPADATSEGQASSPEPSPRLEAPPLPPRYPREARTMVGLSNGPHNNIAFPPPPKRHNVPPPQRPTMLSSSLSSSRFLKSSSAMKWIEKTNKAIEDKLDAVLQGPAGHPGRPAYVSRPQHPGQQAPSSHTSRTA